MEAKITKRSVNREGTVLAQRVCWCRAAPQRRRHRRSMGDVSGGSSGDLHKTSVPTGWRSLITERSFAHGRARRPRATGTRGSLTLGTKLIGSLLQVAIRRAERRSWVQPEIHRRFGCDCAL